MLRRRDLLLRKYIFRKNNGRTALNALSVPCSFRLLNSLASYYIVPTFLTNDLCSPKNMDDTLLYIWYMYLVLFLDFVFGFISYL